MALAILLGTLLVLSALGVPLAFAILAACFATLHEFRPGMPVELFIKTKERKVYAMFLKPLTDQMQRAFREE